ncbi:MAG TPA: poly(3-hydroxyalkanoate) depolymerase [Ramlibacter sp.]|uniref:poly(3-hydroxyalkanoate) depolymerase n=1 Tax=Ramlibacter sp. TaxID=1917967 RepID=UPI002C6F9CA5|nr:poly(3-hydroxyalkanoate) depolymerase [Ramlibacter sp.]HVZ43643.1 poly(3-hydroxyalkanoate) depolymerase [Ramlibacter sp.]
MPLSSSDFETQMMDVDGQVLRVGRQRGGGRPLLLFNGIGANIEMLAPFAQRLAGREIVTFDVPGVGHSLLPRFPYRLSTVARLAARVLDRLGHADCDALGVSWGGAAAQQFARSHAPRCRRLVLCATSAGAAMLPAHPRVLRKMLTPRRYMDEAYAREVAGDLYGGDFRSRPDLVAHVLRHVRWQSRLGYYLQLIAVWGWTSAYWLHRLEQPTLVMHGRDDPLVPLANAHLLGALIPRSELRVVDCGHLFLLTRAEESARAIDEFLNQPDASWSF